MEYKSWKKKNITLRGIKELGKPNGFYGSFGHGLYSCFLGNKSMARKYGKLYFVLNGKPKNPISFQYRNDAEIFVQKIISAFCEKHNHEYDRSFFEKNSSITQEITKIGYDGLVIKGREMVKYNPGEEVLYFEKEDDLKEYFNLNIAL